MDKVRIIIPDYWPPSLNLTHYAHWSRVRRHKKKALDMVFIYARKQHDDIPVFEGPVRMTITRLWGYRMRALDKENLYGSVKPLVDALRRSGRAGGRTGRGRTGGLGIIVDDDPAHLDLTVEQRKNDDGTGRLMCLIQIEGMRAK